jgi:glutamine amidotransferase
MCRWLVYIGNESKNIYDLIFTPSNSILKQSYQLPYTPFTTKENKRDNITNVDGFGIGFYINKDTPFIYTSVKTPWSDINLERISKFFETKLLFTHIRGVKPFNENSWVYDLNCHPFTYKKYMFQHNGYISKFARIKPLLVSLLNSEGHKVIKGSTDSELIFALFISKHTLEELENGISIENMYKYLIDAIKIIIELNNNTPSSFNIALTNQKNTICLRYINCNKEEPPSLYYKKKENSIIISSEPTEFEEEYNWNLIPKNYYLFITNNKIIKKKEILL